MPITNRKFSWTDDQLAHDAFGRVVDLNPDLLLEDLIDARGARLRDAQPICDVGFAAKIPPVRTGIRGLQIADTCFYYPEDRGIAESVRLGRDMARAISS
jgi:protoporphyrinogen oxidase